MTSALTLRFTTQMQLDIQRITLELSDLQRQVSSGDKSNDVMGYASGASLLINAQGLLSQTQARASSANQLTARFNVQSSALSAIADSGANLALAIRDAIAADDGRSLDVDLNLSFASTLQALNETWNGQPLFAGERIGNGPIRISSLEQLAATTSPAELFDEAERHQTVDLGSGSPIVIADKASDISTKLLNAMQSMKLMLDANGGRLGEDIPATQRTQLEDIAAALDEAVREVTAAEGRSGQLQSRIFTEQARLDARSNLLMNEIGSQVDTDPGLVAIQLATLQAQYQATAKVFSDLAGLSLLDYL
ncbi:MAG: hypothetical protein AB7O04_08625 [Hyphomonadaceae bacterium]